MKILQTAKTELIQFGIHCKKKKQSQVRKTQNNTGFVQIK